MTRTVLATFPDARAARQAAQALGRSELAAGPTRVRVDAAAPDRAARLELRVDDADSARAIALMREHGAEVSEHGDEGRDLRTGSNPLAGWGMAIADAITAAMGGATASDAQVPAPEAETGRPRHEAGSGGTRTIVTNEMIEASGTRTRADPADLARADDVPPADPRPPARRPKSDA